MSLLPLFSRLKDAGIHLQVTGDRLKVDGPKGELTPDLMNEIKESKGEIIAFLRKHTQKGEEDNGPGFAEKKDYYVLSSAQKRIYILQQMEKGHTGYNIPVVVRLEGEIKKNKLEEIFRKLIQRHESFRTSFVMVNGETVQRIHEDVGFKIECDEINPKRFVRPFDLAHPPLLRVGLIKIHQTSHILLLDMHHIISDGISTELFLKEFILLYGGQALESIRFQYKDYAEWQKKITDGGSIRLKKQADYWLSQFEGEVPVLNLAVDHVRPAIRSFAGDRVNFEIGKQDSGALKALASREKATLYMLLLAIYNVLLAGLTAQEDIIVGTPAAGRKHSQFQGVMGMFVNTLALRNYPGAAKTFNLFLRELRDRTLMAFQNQDYQFEDLLECLTGKLPGDTGRDPLFDVLFTLQNAGMEAAEIDIPGLKLIFCRQYERLHQVSKSDLTLAGQEVEGKLLFTFEYRTTLFKRETIQRFSRYFKKIVSSILQAPGTKISEIEIIPDDEKRQLLHEFNDTASGYPGDKTIHLCFEEQVARTPDHIAVVAFSTTHRTYRTYMTYTQLKKQSDQLACLLMEKGVQPETIVGIMVERSIEMLIGIFGILKAGGAYLPIDADSPEDRVNYILADSGAGVLLTNLPEGRHLFNCQLLMNAAPNSLSHPTHLCYVIYTSGSTGRPKGVMVAHGSLVNLCSWHNRNFKVTERDRAAQYANVVFDASVWEIFPYLVNGASVHILSSRVKLDMEALNKYYERNCITIAFLPTPVCEQFMVFDNRSLRVLLTGGDKLRTVSLKRGNYRLYNNYGPTENTVVATSFPVQQGYENIPIGKPIDNNCVYILNRGHFRVQPIGVPGELCITGIGLARGYLNNPELTNSKFQIPNYKQIPNPKSQIPNKPYSPTHPLTHSPLYKTGDLARWLPDGNIEFLGRIDQQVKIRGLRIELGEIETQLLKHEDVTEAVVIDRDEGDGNKTLCAYIIPRGPAAARAQELKKYLSGVLPHYMVPSYLIWVENIPLTPGGKVDRSALPAPPAAAVESVYEAPGSEIEKQLAAVWQEVLGLEKISINDDFFRGGGDSIKAMQVSTRLLTYGLKMEISDLLANPTIRQLSLCIGRIDSRPRQVQGPVQGNVPLIPIQKWFFQNRFTHSHHFNQSVMIHRIDGFDEDILRELFTEIVIHHDALRMVYRVEEDSVTQWNRGVEEHSTAFFGFEIIDLKEARGLDARIEEAAGKIQRSIDLKTGPLMRIGLFKTTAGDHLLMVIHHLVVDGVSWRILLEDIAAGYSQLEKGEKIVFRHKTDPFRCWAQKQVEYSGSKALLDELEYWKAVEETETPALPMDFEAAGGKRTYETGETVTLTLDETNTRALLKGVHHAYGTEINDLLLAALGMAVTGWAGIKTIAVNLESHGRHSSETSRTVGWFTSQFPVVLDMRKAKDLSHTIKGVKKILRKVPDKGIGYGILRYLTPPEKRKYLNFGLEPEISFNYLGQFEGGKGNSVFDISRKKIGDSVSPQMEMIYTLDINGIITDGKLTISFSFSKCEYMRSTVEKLAEGFQSYLLNIIRHCAGKEEKEYTLSPMQEGMLFHSLLDRESKAYVEQNVFSIKGEIDTVLFEKSLQALIRRYDIFRTVFVHENREEPQQIVVKERTFKLPVEDISHLTEELKKEYLETFKEKDRHRGFDLSKDLLMRVFLFNTGAGSYKLVWTFHHIIMDGWCLGIVFKDLVRIYERLRKGSRELPPLGPVSQYENYIGWLERRDKAKGLNYWKKYLEGYEQQATLPKLPGLVKKVEKDHYRLQAHRFVLNHSLSARLIDTAKRNKVTLNVLFRAIWGILLQRYNNVHDVVFGAVVSGRLAEIQGIEYMVGLFINTIPVRINTGRKTTFLQLIKELHKESLLSKSHEYLPLAEIQANSALKHHLIDHILVFENYPLQEQMGQLSIEDSTGFSVAGMDFFEQTNYDFDLTVIPGETIQVVFQFNALVYTRDFMKKAALHFREVVKEVVEDIDIHIAGIDIITEEEKQQLLYDFNDTASSYPGNKTLHELFEEQVERTPDNIALVPQHLTYRELNFKSNQLACLLLEKGVQPGTIVGLMVERSPEMLIGIFGILKAGAAYLPIDPDSPEERIKYMLADSGAGVLVTNLPEGHHSFNYQLSIVNCQLSMINPATRNPQPATNFSNLAYVIYTSGSTGKPKGVLVDHYNLLAYVYAFYREFEITADDTGSQQASVAFDAFVEEVYPLLLKGGKVALPTKEEILDRDLFAAFIARNRVTILSCSPMLLNQLNKCHEGLDNVHTFISGGDILKEEYVDNLLKIGKVYNVYGPTETTVCATYCNYTAGAIVPIGKPIANYKVYILDRNNQLQPVGVPGELCISGAGVTRGYLNNPELTEENFLNKSFWRSRNLFSKRFLAAGGILYRTGDLARWLSDHNIEFLGRIDQQVKIRGFRIEPGEIENHLSKHHDVKEALVVAREDETGDKYLCAYIVAERRAQGAGRELKKYLSRLLPQYMIPAYFIPIEKIPLTPNDKVDQKALPEPERGGAIETYTAPVDEVEEKLVEIWADVLRIKKETIGTNDRFFDLGGHSLRATILVSRVRKAFNVEFPLARVFETPTIKAFADYIKTAGTRIYQSIAPVEKQEYYPQSSAQKRLFFLDRFETTGTGYNMPSVLRIIGELDIKQFEKAILGLIERHESLRTSFHMINNEPVQRVHDQVEFEIQYHDSLIPQFIRPFNLSQAPLLRVGLSKKEHILVVDMHHIIADGTSTAILVEDFVRMYEGEKCSSLKIQYKDFAAWQNTLFETGRIKEQEEYWLSIYPAPADIPRLNLPTDYPRPAVFRFEGSHYGFMLEAEHAASFKRVAADSGNGITLFMNLLAAFKVFLYKYTGQEDIIVGTGIMGRPHDALHHIIGMFVNSLPLRNLLTPVMTYREFLIEVAENTLRAFENQDLQFEALVDRLNPERDPSRSPVFDVSLVVQNFELPTKQMKDVKVEPCEFENKIAKFDLTLFANETGEGISFLLEYCTALFKEETIRRMAGHFINTIKRINENSNRSLAEIEIITAGERHQLLYDFNNTDVSYAGDKTIHQLFEDQAGRTPDGIAIHRSYRTYRTYNELNRKSDQLAHLLRQKGVGPGTLVGIMVEQPLEIAKGILGILKAGGAYLPIDPAYPQERIKYILSDSGAKVLLTNLPEGHHLFNCQLSTSSSNLAYVIYTSGTTGKPKGVVVEHRSVVNTLLYRKEEYRMDSDVASLQLFSYTFDAFVESFFTPLISGARLILLNREDAKDIAKIKEVVVKNHVTHLICVPALYRAIIQALTNREAASLKVVTLGGDRLTPDIVQITKSKNKNIEIINEYGVTEASVLSTISRHQEREDCITIGHPIWNTRLYILDQRQRLQPLGVPGELYISGTGLARGYLNQPELTAERFVGFHRSYRTGDLARWLPPGNPPAGGPSIEFLGRIDHQVKVRGFRIELEEIESCLKEIEVVKEVVVDCKTGKNGEKYLCAYVVPAFAGAFDKTSARELAEYLSTRLPGYMVPAYFIPIETIPLTPNGKIDRKALPGPQTTVLPGPYETPVDEVETKMAVIWQQVLGVERIGRDDHFFEMGGDSIKAIQVSARLLREGLKLEISDLFANPTIKQVRRKTRRVEQHLPRAVQGSIQGKVPLTPIQKWFFETYPAHGHHFNQAVMLYRRDGFDEVILEKVFTKLLEHHDALRMIYEVNHQESVKQMNRGLDGKLFDFEMFHLRNKDDVEKEIEREANRIQTNIDLKKGPLVKLGLFKTGEGDHLLIIIHHLVVDGVAWRILLEDFSMGYNQAEQGEPIVFVEKTHSFREWAHRLMEYSKSREVLKEVLYWKEVEEIKDQVPSLPRDAEASAGERKLKDVETVTITLEEIETRRLLRDIHHLYNTEINDILLTALGLALKEWAGLAKAVINVEGHGREPITANSTLSIARTVGWFTSQYPVVLDMSKSKELSYNILYVKETLRKIPHKGIGYGILKYLAPEEQRKNLTFGREPEINFNYLGQFAQELGHSRGMGISPFNTGESFSPELEAVHSLDIGGILVDGRLHLRISYHRKEYKKNNIETLAAVFMSYLKEIIAHCIRKEEKIKAIYPMAPMQAGMLFHSLKEKTSRAYVEQHVFSIRGAVDSLLFEKSFNALIQRYDIFRTVFVREDLDEPVQVVLRERTCQMPVEDISHLAGEEQTNYLKTFIDRDREKGFDLSKDLLMRIFLFKIGTDSYKLVWTFHHIIMDGWCQGIVFADMVRAYEILRKGELLKSEPSGVPQYRNYIDWLQQQDKTGGLEFWKNYLDGYEQQAVLPKFLKPVKEKNYRLEEHYLVLDESMSNGLREITRKHRVTLNTLFQVVWGILLQRYNNTDDVVFGAVVSGRPPEIEGIEEMVGLFINTVPVRIKTGSESTPFVLQLIKNLHRQALLAKPHEYVPLAEIQANSILKGNLIDHIMVFENYPVQETIKHIGRERPLGFSLEGMESIEQTGYDFNFIVVPGETIRCLFSFNGRVYDPDFVQQLALHFKEILRRLVENPGLDIAVKEFEIITGEEKQQLLYDFNDTEAAFPKDKTVHELFEEQVERTPDNIAIHMTHRTYMTYNELNEQSDHLACRLRYKGVGPDTIVGLMVERSVEMITGILGILKAGGAYLPIAANLPGERVEYILADSGAGVLLTNLPEGHHSFNYQLSMSNPAVSSANLAYVIYTSGSTGRPKGVMLEHRNLVNLLFYCFQSTNLDFSRVLQFTTISFDVSFQEIFLTFLSGGKLFLIREELTTDIPGLFEVIEKNEIKTLFLPMSLLKIIFNESHYTDLFPGCVRHIQTAGEQVVVSERFRDYLKAHRIYLHNHYGPSETHVVTALTLDPSGEIPHLPSIGRPVSNTVIYILNRYGKLQPVGVPGELYIGGIQVGRGYLNNPEITAEKFLIIKSFCGVQGRFFQKKPLAAGGLLYKTGDLARWLSDGSIYFLGRIDQQVKIRGFRIEPGEIETLLLNHETVQEAVVVVKTDAAGEKYLCAYYVGGRGEELKRYLSKKVPDYMVPSYFVQLDSLPLTPSGKVDRRVLPDPGIKPGDRFIAPRNAVEETLSRVWSEILKTQPGKIGIDDNFFESGGHSLKAMLLAAKIHQVLKVKIPLAKIFEAPTIREIARYITHTGESIYKAIQPVEKREYYSQSSAQKRLFFLDKLEDIGTNYNMPYIYKVDGVLDIDWLQEVFRRLIQRHESLRTSFHEIDGQPVQKVHDSVEFEILYGHTIENFVRPFDLSQVPLLRVGLMKTGDHRHILMLDMHHIISDGFSHQILVRDFMSLYAGKELPLLKLHYKDYSLWQKSEEQIGNVKELERYWLGQFEGDIPVLNVPTDYTRPVIQSFEGDCIDFEIGSEETRALKALASREDATLYMVLFAIFNVLLAKLSGQEDIIVGTPVVGRKHENFHEIIGMFVNTLAMRNYPVIKKPFDQFLEEVKDGALEAFENQEYQFEDLVEKLTLNRDMSRNPLFDVMFTLQNIEIPALEIPGLKLKPYAIESKTSKFDMTLSGFEGEQELLFSLEFCTKLFKRETIERFVTYFKAIVSVVAATPGKKIVDIEIISAQERKQLLVDFNDTATEYPFNKTIPGLFEEQAVSTPDRIALVGHGRLLLTYKELNEKSGQLAFLLIERGVKPDTIVGLMLERSIEMIVGILAILKSGGAYLPIDPGYPEERIQYMLKDSGAKVLLTNLPEGHPFNCQLSIVNCQLSMIGEVQPTYRRRAAVPTHLSYVIYTSGTTGKPKGTLTTHRNVIRVVKNTNYTRLTGEDRVLQLSNYAFDGSVFDIYGALLNGAALVLVEKGQVSDVDALGELILREKITVFFVTTALFNTLVDLKLECLRNVRNVLFGGERVSVAHTRKALELLGKDKVIHMYGPTETTVYASYHFVNKIDETLDTVPIGKPISNTSIYILDKALKPVPIGITGEIYIGGPGVARGYLNRPELTAESFIGFHRSYRSYISYRTGDLARWLPGCHIEFLGRIDNQVKIRGFRIELGEIENRLLKHHEIKEAVVVVKEDEEVNQKCLCGYIVSTREFSTSELREYLSHDLPGYMIPSYFVQLEEMPLTPNGKCDRKSLPVPGFKAGEAYAAPRNEKEAVLVEIWAEVLGIKKDRIGIDTNFFDLSGHSLKATSLVSRIHKELNIKIPLEEMFQAPTIRGLSRYITKAAEETFAPIEPVEKKEYYPLSAAQRRLYIMQQLKVDYVSYNQSMAVVLEGNVVKEKLQEVFRKLIRRHESLRTSFEIIEKQPIQRIHPDAGFEVEVIDIDFIRPFDLSRPPLLRVGLGKLEERKHILMVDMHHIISDGTSMTLFIREFTALYEGKELPELRIRYKDFSQWQNNLAAAGEIKKQEDYWLNQFKGDIPRLNLPYDYPENRGHDLEGAAVAFEIGKELAIKTKSLMQETGTTWYMLILAVYNILLFKYTGREDIVVGSGIAGRRHVDLQHVIGMFVNMLAMRNRPEENKTFTEFLDEVKENALQAYENQDYPFDQLIETLGVERESGRNPLFDTQFTFQNLLEQPGEGLPEAEIKDFNIKPYENGNKGLNMQFDLSLDGIEAGDTVHMSFQYVTALFKESTIREMTKHILDILEQVVENRNMELKEIHISHELVVGESILSEEESLDYEF